MKFCTSCGTRLDEDVAAQTPMQPVTQQNADSDRVIMEKMASAQGDIGLIDGKMVLTETTLLFKPRFYQVAADVISMPLRDITEVKKEKYLFLFNMQMQVTLKSGEAYTFMVYGRDKFIDALEKQMRFCASCAQSKET